MFQVNNEDINMNYMNIVLLYLLWNLNNHISTGSNHLTL